MEENKFVDTIKPFLNYIDNGSFFRKPLKWLYAAIGVLNLLFPIYMLYKAIESGLFKLLEGKEIFFLLVVWLVIMIAGWLSFQLWWHRKENVYTSSSDDDEFVATPAFSHLVQTLGEWLGAWVAVVGFFISLILTIAFGNEAEFLGRALGIGFISYGFFAALMMPLYGFVIIIFSRFLAEQFKALTAIAKNTSQKDKRNSL